MPDGILILTGATASGKSEIAVKLAREFNAEIVGADSRQIYRGMPIGTAAPSAAQMAEVPHHLVGFLDPHERYSAARFTQDARDAIGDILRRGKRAIVSGGTGFYLRALCGGVVLAPQYDEVLRGRLAREALRHPPEFLYEWLVRRDPKRAAAVHPGDTYRVLRALEVALAGRAAARGGELQTLASEGNRWTLVFLDVPLEELDRRIAERTARMLSAGFVDEAERVGETAVAANAVGYPAALAYLRGWSTLDELRASLERSTRQYARRQRTWFRREPATIWCAPESLAAIVREKLRWRAN
ncbi:MAG TPA: tRNA (adenosine(37)-N6)-dimethylallyltransferase MiaA [Candidatus Cybelea sp.]|nr:tRNA (adenosine(37)-N6)-dimethylallyltransferase MiaA [Candidatus Cybelea sp.]